MKKESKKQYLDVDFREYRLAKEKGALWDNHKKRWFIKLHQNLKDFKWWLPFKNTEEVSEDLEELTIEEQILDMENSLTLHAEVIRDILKEKVKKDYFVEQEETPREEYARQLQELYEEYEEDKEAWSNTSRVDPESLAFLIMSDENKEKMIN